MGAYGPGHGRLRVAELGAARVHVLVVRATPERAGSHPPNAQLTAADRPPTMEHMKPGCCCSCDARHWTFRPQARLLRATAKPIDFVFIAAERPLRLLALCPLGAPHLRTSMAMKVSVREQRVLLYPKANILCSETMVAMSPPRVLVLGSTACKPRASRFILLDAPEQSFTIIEVKQTVFMLLSPAW